jgi:glutamate racemase
MALKGTPAERQAQKSQQRETNRITHVTKRAGQARGGHQLVVVACNAALAASKRITDDARKRLARAVAEVVEQHDIPENRKERP